MGMAVTFELDGQLFTGINGGREFKFDEAISLLVNCDNQEEIDAYGRGFRRAARRDCTAA
jgi:predicted 3-demethylubiquinone-9 3-methyltransferase (glyoxalase superfamily)